MTHAECCDHLLRAARRFDRAEITVQQWFEEVDRVLTLSFPDALARQTPPRDETLGLVIPSRTNTAPGTQPLAADRSPARAGDPAGAAA